MNFVGKLLTGLIAFFAIVFMTLSMAVYTGRTNWKNEADARGKLLKEEQQKVAELNTKLDTLNKQFTDEKNELADKLKTLVAEKDNLVAQTTKLEQDKVSYFNQHRAAVAELKTANEAMAVLESEVGKLRTQIVAAQTKQKETFDSMVKLTDNLHQVANELATAKRVNQVLTEDFNKARLVLDRFNLVADPLAYVSVPPPVEGHVTAVSDTGTRMIEINLGSDHGLQEGHELEVFRPNSTGVQYLSRVKIVEAKPEKAVAKILPNFQKGTIQKGDNVTSIR